MSDDGIEYKGLTSPRSRKTITHGLFVANNTTMQTAKDHLMIITGPNMAGKSTICALQIVLMGQIGCFVPAKVLK